MATAQELPPGGVSAFAPTRALHIRFRRASMRWMTRWPVKQLIARQFDKAGDIDLPDYDARDRRRLDVRSARPLSRADG